MPFATNVSITDTQDVSAANPIIRKNAIAAGRPNTPEETFHCQSVEIRFQINSQSRHNNLGEFLNFLLYTAEYDPCCQRKKDQHKYDWRNIRCNKGCEIPVCRSFCSIRNNVYKQIFCDPAAAKTNPIAPEKLLLFSFMSKSPHS